MNHIARTGLALVAALLFTSCGGKTTPVGRYALDSEHFAGTVTGQLVQQGKIPAAMEERARTMMRSAVFDLELKQDNTFTARQQVGNERHTYAGTWSLAGTTFRLQQTQEDGQDRADSMSGTLVGDTIEVTHEEKGIAITMHLHRVPEAASPR